MKKIIYFAFALSFISIVTSGCAGDETKYSSESLRNKTSPELWHSYFEHQILGEEKEKENSSKISSK